MKYIKEFKEHFNNNFWNWFGESKVVDKDGKPLVVYHGTSKDFDSFDTKHMGKNFKQSILGIYFTNGAKPDMGKGIPYGSTASEYAFNSQEGGYAEAGGANVLPVYLTIKKPLYIEADGWYSPVAAIDNQKSDILREVKSGDYDGIITYFEDEEEDSNEVVYIVFKSSQIKSAIGNNGNFNPSSNNINESKIEDDLLKRLRGFSDEVKDLIKPLITSESDYKNGRVTRLKTPSIKGKHFSGLGISADKNGLYIHTHRARSKSYMDLSKIPNKEIKFIESTG